MIDIIFHDETGIAPCLPGQMGGFENTDGDGEIHYYRLFDGVGIMLLRLEMESYTEIRTQAGVLEINFCINGRFETSFSMRDRVLLKPGDMAVSCYDGFHGSRSESCFPLGYYEGICLEVDPEAASSWITQNAPAFRVDFSALKEDLLDSKWYMVGSAGSRCEHVFRELYESASYADRTFLQLKALEAFQKAADGKATKIIIPSEIQGLAGLAAGLKGIVESDQPTESSETVAQVAKNGTTISQDAP